MKTAQKNGKTVKAVKAGAKMDGKINNGAVDGTLSGIRADNQVRKLSPEDWQEAKRHVIREYEKHRPETQLLEWLKMEKDKKMSGVVELRMDVPMAPAEWFELMDVANGEGWTLTEAVGELAYRGLERYAVTKLIEAERAEWKAQQATAEGKAA